MKKKNILIIGTLISSTLIVGCSETNIVLNENTKVEQSYFSSKNIVKEKDFKLNVESGISFEPSFIGEDGVYGFTHSREEKNESNDNLLKRVLNDGTIENSNDNFENRMKEKSELPYVLQEKVNSEIIYKNYFTGNEKIILSGVRSSKLSEGLIKPITVIENSPYAVVLESSDNLIGRLEKTINIVNLITGEKFRKSKVYDNWEGPRENFLKMDETYFYTGEEGVVYSISNGDGRIKKLILKEGTIEESDYDQIINNDYSTVNKFRIYSSGLETRIICTTESFYGKDVEKQVAYKVSSKEYELLYDFKSKKGNVVNCIKMLPNDFMICKINDEYVFVKFDENGIKLVDKFDFSDVATGEYDNIKDIKVATNQNGSQILIKIIIVNSNSGEISEVKVPSTNPQTVSESNRNNNISEVYKMYEINE